MPSNQGEGGGAEVGGTCTVVESNSTLASLNKHIQERRQSRVFTHLESEIALRHFASCVGMKADLTAAVTLTSGYGSLHSDGLPYTDHSDDLRCKGVIMDGVECDGGGIEEIHWWMEDLDGTLPVGDLNMPKLRVLDLAGNGSLKGERE